MLAIGNILGPLFGRVLYEWIGYKYTFAVVTGGIFLLGAVFLLFGGVF